MIKKLILHRGYKGKYPENSKIAFENALKQGLFFETDIKVYHNNCYMTHNEISKISNEMVSLEKFCELIKNAESKEGSIFVHIKELRDIEEVMKILKEYDFKERIRLFACDEITMDLIDIIKKEHPQYKVGLHFYENNNFGEEDFKNANFIWADEITKKNITTELISLAHKLKKPVYAISPEIIPESIFNQNIQKRWRELLDIGVDGICTDKPDEFLEFI